MGFQPKDASSSLAGSTISLMEGHVNPTLTTVVICGIETTVLQSWVDWIRELGYLGRLERSQSFRYETNLDEIKRAKERCNKLDEQLQRELEYINRWGVADR